MNYRSKTRVLNPDTGLYEDQPQAQSTGIGAEDWAGIGMQIHGAVLADKEAGRQENMAEEIRRENIMLQKRRERMNQYQSEVGAQQTNRSMNMDAMDALGRMRGQARERSNQYSFKR